MRRSILRLHWPSLLATTTAAVAAARLHAAAQCAYHAAVVAHVRRVVPPITRQRDRSQRTVAPRGLLPDTPHV